MTQGLANSRRSVKGTGLKCDNVENTPTIPASSVGKGPSPGKGRTVSLPGYILAQTNNALLEATNLSKQTNPGEEEGEAIVKVNLAAAPCPHQRPLPPLGRKAFSLTPILQKDTVDTEVPQSVLSEPTLGSAKTERIKETAFL